MLIEQIFPQIVAAKGKLAACLMQEAKSAKLSSQEAMELGSALPAELVACECFLDRMTGLWRYEFGLPYHVNEATNLMWGTHMWVPVKHLFAALRCVLLRLPADQRGAYLRRLTDRDKHQDVLCEMAPLQHVAPEVPADFEVPGLGVGNRKIDWVLGPLGGRRIILDVKRRAIDFIKQADQIAANDSTASAPPPDHDAAMLFRSVASKLRPSDPAVQLQGVWINTDIKQEDCAFGAAFDALDGTKVHFALLGDWKADVHIVTRRDGDRPFILEMLGVKQSDRFTFSLEAPNARTDDAEPDAPGHF